MAKVKKKAKTKKKAAKKAKTGGLKKKVKKKGRVIVSKNKKEKKSVVINRVQVGARMEERIVKVLKGVAECANMSLGEALEEIILHCFEGAKPFSPKMLKKIKMLKKVYGLDYDTHANSRFKEA